MISFFPSEGKHEPVIYTYMYMSHSVPTIIKWETHHSQNEILTMGNSKVGSETPFATLHHPSAVVHVTMACHHWKLTTLWPARRVVHHWPARSACLPSASKKTRGSGGSARSRRDSLVSEFGDVCKNSIIAILSWGRKQKIPPERLELYCHEAMRFSSKTVSDVTCDMYP